MVDHFRLVYLKSPELENQPFDETSISFYEKKISNKSLFPPEKNIPETFSSQEILKQAKSDLKHPDSKMRILAVKYYLERSNLSITMPLLQEILADPDSEVRAQALSSLIKFRNPIVSPFLKRHLRDSDPKVRMIALRGMFQFKEKMNLNLIMQFLSDDSPWVRRKVATLLGWTQMEGALPILMEMSKDEDSRVRKAALFSLVTLYPDEGLDRLMEAMTDSDPDIRKWTRDYLDRMLKKPIRGQAAFLQK